jgi:acetyl-CoA carboxylase carboxyltransferase component
MRVFASSISRDSDEYRTNHQGSSELVAELRKRLGETQAQWQGDERVLARWRKEGRLLARERIELLLDDDSPFLELCALAGYGQEDVNVGSTIVGGVGLVCGVMCVITANVATIKVSPKQKERDVSEKTSLT